MPRRSARDGGGTEPSTRLRSQHVEATRRAVVGAARSLFGKTGYAQTSVDEIAAAARLTKGAVYHHFASKEALFRAVRAEVEAAAQARAAAALDPRLAPIDQIVAGVNAYLDAALDEEIRRITLVDGPALLGLEPDGPVDQQASHVEMRSFIASATARGELVDLDPDVLAHLIGGLALQGGLLIARARDPEITRATLGPALDALLRGLAPGATGDYHARATACVRVPPRLAGTCPRSQNMGPDRQPGRRGRRPREICGRASTVMGARVVAVSDHVGPAEVAPSRIRLGSP